MKDKPLANVRVAILATNDFEQSEMTEPRQALMEAGAQTTLIAPKSGKLQAMKHAMKADYFDVDLLAAGIIDSTKVVRTALENAVSVASVLLLTEATLTEIPEPKAPGGASSEMPE